VIVAVFFGSRDWADAWTVEEVVEKLLVEGDGSLKGIHGGARGADLLADQVLRRRGLTPTSVPAAWHVHDREGATPVPCRCALPRPHENDTCRAAGIRRNQLIIDQHLKPAIEDPDAQVWACGFRTTGRSPGTDDMRERLRPLVQTNQVAGLMRTASGFPPEERRRLWVRPDRSKGLEPFPPPGDSSRFPTKEVGNG
jgi:hypothetical protein